MITHARAQSLKKKIYFDSEKGEEITFFPFLQARC